MPHATEHASHDSGITEPAAPAAAPPAPPAPARVALWL